MDRDPPLLYNVIYPAPTPELRKLYARCFEASTLVELPRPFAGATAPTSATSVALANAAANAASATGAMDGFVEWDDGEGGVDA